MNRKIWFIVFLLGSLILLMGGTHRPERSVPAAEDPVVKRATSIVTQAVDGTSDEWRKAAAEAPVLILQAEAVVEE